MERLIHDLLDFSRVDARGTDHFVRTSCDEALNDAIRNLQFADRGEQGGGDDAGACRW